MWRICPRLSGLRGRSYHSGRGCYGHRLDARASGISGDVWSQCELDNRASSANLLRLATAYRDHGHRYARINPLKTPDASSNSRRELSPTILRLSASDQFSTAGILNHSSTASQLKVPEIEAVLQELYCGPIAVEVQHMPDEAERDWFIQEYESRRLDSVDSNRRLQLAEMMLKSQAFDAFMAKRYSTVKRYSGEGAEAMLCFIDQLIACCASDGVEDLVIGMPHRGRLNLMTGLLHYSPQAMFYKLAGNSLIPDNAQGEEDVLMHLYSEGSVKSSGASGGSVNVTLLPNPSHLEAVNPVACGVARTKEQLASSGHYSPEDHISLSGGKALCLQIHGDAACSAQGIVTETLGFSQVPHFSTGGSVHLIVNNQIGFTTPSDRGRSSAYASDIGKIVGAPVLHVNGDDPEAVVKACEIAMSYRQRWRKDVFVDMLCYRRWGHNEMDEPMFTQPAMYSNINHRTSVPDAYVEKLKASVPSLDTSRLDSVGSDHFAWLDKQQSAVADFKVTTDICCYPWVKAGLVQPHTASLTTWDTGCPVDFLQYIAAKSVDVPEKLSIHPRLQRAHVDARLAQIADSATSTVDWATAECMAMGSLLLQGFPVRISGQDVGRGTFSHRHAMLVDQTTDELYVPLNHMKDNQSSFLEIASSPLSEEAVMAFEYGMSIANPNSLCIWEAQFGDFFNGAQIILDTFIASGESKWQFQSPLVLLLPNGMDGAGPEHSSCRLERFLQLSDSKEDALDGDSVNWHVAYPTTPAQYYHLLRRQMVRNFRKPLVVASPKVLLRLPAAVSPLSSMAPGTCFEPVLTDSIADPNKVERIIFCSGKHYYALVDERERTGRLDTAIARLELLAPFPAHHIATVLGKFSKAKKFVWSQEESSNMGAWSFVSPRFSSLLNVKLSYHGRPVAATPAVGVGKRHQQQAAAVVADPFSTK